MKKLLSLILIFTMLLTFGACQSKEPETNGESTSSQTSQQPSSQPANDSKILVAYFSATGNTKNVAEKISENLKADIFEIVPSNPYTKEDLDYNTDCRANREMNDPNARPEISNSVGNMADYDVVFIGYPIWWGETPRIISTFLESYDFSGKTVVTFSTSGGSSHSDSNISGLLKNAKLVTGKRFSANSDTAQIAEWISSLDI